jgi:hypothetical protein
MERAIRENTIMLQRYAAFIDQLVVLGIPLTRLLKGASIGEHTYELL